MRESIHAKNTQKWEREKRWPITFYISIMGNRHSLYMYMHGRPIHPPTYLVVLWTLLKIYGPPRQGHLSAIRSPDEKMSGWPAIPFHSIPFHSIPFIPCYLLTSRFDRWPCSGSGCWLLLSTDVTSQRSRSELQVFARTPKLLLLEASISVD